MNKIRANHIAAKALKVRKKFLNADAHMPICAFNLAEAMGFDVRFVKIDSFEGMYLSGEEVILISAERPEGRKAFTCAHEIGHAVLGHGTIIDEIIEDGQNCAIEYEADFFGSMLLMPPSVVIRSCKNIGVNPMSISPIGVYILSKYIGVSYKALITQLYFNLKLIDFMKYSQLKKTSPLFIKNELISGYKSGEIFIVSSWWKDKAIDVVVGDYVICEESIQMKGLPLGVISEENGRVVLEAHTPGIVKITNGEGWNAFVRISRKGYFGMCQFRHEEEVI